MASEDQLNNTMVDENVIDVLGDGGIIKKILRAAPDTEQDTPPSGSEVVVHYTGTLASNGKKFDSSKDRNEPFKFKIKEGQVIKGWDEGVSTMRRGEVAMFTLRQDYAYGKNGSPPSIPPNATLNFEVELLDFNDEQEVSQFITKKVLSAGEGWRNAEEEGASVTVNLKIYPKDDESKVVERLENFKFVFGDEMVVNTVEEAIGSMKLSEKALFTITKCKPCSYLQYTSHSDAFKQYYQNESNSNTILKMEVQLLSLENEKNTWDLSAGEKLSLAEQKKEQGNEFYKNNRISLAQRRYERALRFIEDERPEDESEEDRKRREQILTSVYLNLGAIYTKLSDWNMVIQQCNKCLEVDGQNIKAFYRKAQAQQSMGELEEAQQTLEDCVGTCSNVTSDAQQQMLTAAKTLLTKVTKAIADQKKKEKEMFGKMFK